MDHQPPEQLLETREDRGQSIATAEEAYSLALQSGTDPQIEDYVRGFSEPDLSDLIERLVEASLKYSLLGSTGRSSSETIDYTAYIRRFPEHAALVERVYLRLIGVDEDSSATETVREGMPAQIDRFEIKRKLGTGGFGVVYQAYDPKLKRDVALKVARLRAGLSETDLQKLYDEASSLAQLDDPHLARVFEPGRTSDGMPFVVMQFYEGSSLADRIKTALIPPEETASIIADLAEALQIVHALNLVHRDIKPGNILFDKLQRPVLVDFGLALLNEEVGSGARVAGTVPYMSPEQAAGKSHLADPRSDIFSLGVVMFQMLTGKLPYRSKSAEQMLEEIAHGEPSSARQFNPAIPAELDRICQKARQKRTSDRYNTARELAEDLRVFLAPASPKRKTPLLAGVCGLGILGLIIWSLIPAPAHQPASATSTPIQAPITLKAPVLQMLHPGVESVTGQPTLTDVVASDVPLPEGDQLALKVALASDASDAYLYLFHFGEGQSPRLLWPENLAKQQRARSIRYPSEGQVVELEGPPRRMMLVAAVRHEPLQPADLEKLDGLQFDFTKELNSSESLVELIYPEDSARSRNRSAGLGKLKQFSATTIQSTSPKRDLAVYFPAFDAWLFHYRSVEKP